MLFVLNQDGNLRSKYANSEKAREFVWKSTRSENDERGMVGASSEGNAGFLSHILKYISVQDVLKALGMLVNELSRPRELS